MATLLTKRATLKHAKGLHATRACSTLLLNVGNRPHCTRVYLHENLAKASSGNGCNPGLGYEVSTLSFNRLPAQPFGDPVSGRLEHELAGVDLT